MSFFAWPHAPAACWQTRPPGRPGGPPIRGRCIARPGPRSVARAAPARPPGRATWCAPGGPPAVVPGPWSLGRGPRAWWPAACYLVRALVRLVPGARPPILAAWWPIRGPRRVRPGGRRPWRVRPGARYLVRGRRCPVRVPWPWRAAPGCGGRAQKTAPVAVDEGLGPVSRGQCCPEQFHCSPETDPLCKKLDFGLQFFVEQIQFVP